MTWFGGIVAYVIVWWLIFFMALPFGVKAPDEVEPGHEPSAPDKPMLWRKAAVTTVIAAVVTAGIWWVAESGLISFRYQG